MTVNVHRFTYGLTRTAVRISRSSARAGGIPHKTELVSMGKPNNALPRVWNRRRSWFVESYATLSVYCKRTAPKRRRLRTTLRLGAKLSSKLRWSRTQMFSTVLMVKFFVCCLICFVSQEFRPEFWRIRSLIASTAIGVRHKTPPRELSSMADARYDHIAAHCSQSPYSCLTWAGSLSALLCPMSRTVAHDIWLWSSSTYCSLTAYPCSHHPILSDEPFSNRL